MDQKYKDHKEEIESKETDFQKKKHPYYKTCPFCGANLDPGEQCDCQ